MDSDVPVEPSPSISDAALESKETGFHLLVLAVLLVSALVLFAGFLAMLIVFLLYLLMLIFHWAWGWSALACAGVLLISSIVSGVIFRFQIIKPLYPPGGGGLPPSGMEVGQFQSHFSPLI